MLTAKARILHYLDYKKVSQYEFTQRTGLSNGMLKVGSNISSNNLKAIADIYKDLSLAWVITGEGPMIRGERGAFPYPMGTELSMFKETPYYLENREQEEIVKTLQKLISVQEDLILSLKEQIDTLKQLKKSISE